METISVTPNQSGKFDGERLLLFKHENLSAEYDSYVDENGSRLSKLYAGVFVPNQDIEDYHLDRYRPR